MSKVPCALSWLVTIESDAGGAEGSSLSPATVSEETPEALGPQMMQLLTLALHEAHQSGPNAGAKFRWQARPPQKSTQPRRGSPFPNRMEKVRS